MSIEICVVHRTEDGGIITLVHTGAEYRLTDEYGHTATVPVAVLTDLIARIDRAVRAASGGSNGHDQ